MKPFDFSTKIGFGILPNRLSPHDRPPVFCHTNVKGFYGGKGINPRRIRNARAAFSVSTPGASLCGNARRDQHRQRYAESSAGRS
jgi:hypothetical protein